MLAPSPLKAACNRAHARTRAYERYALELSVADILAIEGRLRTPDAGCVPLFHDREGRDRTTFALRRDGRWLAVMRDNATDSVLTFLPEKVLDPYLPSLEPTRKAEAGPPRVAEPCTILGFIALPDAVSPEAMDTIPPLPPALSALAPPDRVLACRDALAARQRSIEGLRKGRYGTGLNQLNALLAETTQRLAAIAPQVKLARQANHEIHQAARMREAGIDDPASVRELGRRAIGLAHALAARLDWQLIEGEPETFHALQAAAERGVFGGASGAGAGAP